MQLNIRLKSDENIQPQFQVTVLNKTNVLNADSKNISFDFNEPGQYCIEFLQVGEDESFTLFQKLIFILFVPIIGLFSALSSYGETTSVFEKIDPYLIKQRFTLDINGDMQVDVCYSKSVFEKKTKTWTKPTLHLSEGSNCGVPKYSVNTKEFENSYYNFKRSFGPACFNVAVIFAIIAVLGLKSSNYMVFCSFLSISILVLLVMVFTLAFVKRKIQKSKECLKIT